MVGTVVEPITLHYTGTAGATATIAPGTLVDVLEHDPAGLYRIRCEHTPWTGTLVDEEHVVPDTTDPLVTLFGEPDEREA